MISFCDFTDYFLRNFTDWFWVITPICFKMIAPIGFCDDFTDWF